MVRRILLIEDNAELAKLLALHLREARYEVELTADGPSGFALAKMQSYDLILLDIMLPGLDGFEICRNLRLYNHFIPILMLSAKATELDRVRGFESGADDYVTKPFGILELLARIKALFRRVDIQQYEYEKHQTWITYRDIRMDIEKRKATKGHSRLELTAKEFDLLALFARHPGRVFTRGELLSQVWGYGHEGYEHTVNTHINRLRSKLETNPANPQYVLTVWGIGYKFAEV